MPLFNFRRSKQNNVVPQNTEERSCSDNSQYTYPVGLSFLKEFGPVDPLTISAVYSAVSLISNSIAQIPIHVRNIDTGEIVSHPIHNVLHKGLMTKFNLMKSLITDMLLHGNGLAYIERAADGTPTGIIYCPSGTYTIYYNDHSRVLYYQIPDVTKKKVEPINVIHIYKDSKNGVVGREMKTFAGPTYALCNAAESAAEDYYSSNCNLDAILKSSRPLTNEQRADIKSQWLSARSQHNGKGKSIAVLGNDLDYQPIGSNASESQLLETREFNIQEVARFFNMSPQLLGDLDHTQYGSLEQAQLDFIMHCLMPYISMIEEEFNKKLLKPSESSTLYIDFDEMHLMKADKASTANYLTALTSNGIMTINEARHQLDLAPIEGGDKLIVPFTKIEDNTINTSNKEDE